MNEQVIGILGGMGPEATLELFRIILSLTPAKQDQDHYRILIDNNPKIPDRTAAILHQGPDPFKPMQESALTLEQAGADFIIMPCNTAHFWLSELRQAVTIPIIDMIGETAAAITHHSPLPGSVGLLATSGTIEVGLYQNALQNRHVNCLLPEQEDQAAVMDAIYKVKAADYSGRESLIGVCNRLFQRGAQGIVLGCTELPLLLKPADLSYPLFDPLSILARAAVQRIMAEARSPNS